MDLSPSVTAVGTEGDRSGNGDVVHLGWGAVAQCLVQSAIIIKLEISAKIIHRLGHGLIGYSFNHDQNLIKSVRQAIY